MSMVFSPMQNVGGYCEECDYGATLSSGKVTAFDITELVCKWKREEHFEDAGFILINSTEIKNKSYCSSEYGTTSYRPYVELTYTSELWLDEDSLDIAEGGTGSVIAIANPEGKMVTWDIKDKTIATISSSDYDSCVVKGIKAGKTELVVRVEGEDVEPVICDVFVHIEDGVYYIKNVNSVYCLEVSNGSIFNYTKVSQSAQYSNLTDEVTRLRQMWRVTYLGEGAIPFARYMILKWACIGVEIYQYVISGIRIGA